MANTAAQETSGRIKVTLVRSVIGRPQDQAATVQTLGLRKIHQSVEVPDTDATRGMINKVRHLVTAEDVNA